MLKISISFLLFVFYSFTCQAQCGFTVSTFPYQQGFETTTGGWASGGTGNDWAWGTPTKAFITNAGGGTKCWVTGGLSGSLYTNGARSYVTSPCFDFSSLSNPIISFKIYWECENTYDGAIFQSSIDNGVTWINVGSDTDPPSCMAQNWFNVSNIINLSSLANPKCGWAGSSMPSSGSCQGNGGSNGWLTAKHCLGNLAGQSSVRFRFAFGAGTTCNNYDGIAFDDIKIEESAINNANFTYACTSTSLQYQFTNSSTPCPTNFVWNFGDPASGVNNGTGLQNPTHIFSAPGTYTVTLTVSGPCNSSSTITKIISTLDMNLNSTNLICANTINGSINATSINATGTPLFTLQPLGISNSTGNFAGLNSAIYTISITDAIGCSVTSTVNITSPPLLIWSAFTPTNISCNGLQDGKINVQVAGGTGTIIYNVMPGNMNSSNGAFINLSANIYTVTATDINGCTTSSITTIIEPTTINLVSSSQQNVLCKDDNNGMINISYVGGTGSLNYILNPGAIANTSGIFSNLNAGFYTITCSDVNGCSKSSTFLISEPPKLLLNAIDIKQPGCNPNNDGEVTINASGGTPPLNYTIGGAFGTSPQFTNMTSNTYTVIVKDANGCTVSSLAILKSIDAPLFTSIVVNDITCANKNDGSIEVSATGNAAIQSYILSPGFSINASGLFVSLSANIYVITVSDMNGCTNTTSLIIKSPPLLQIDSLIFINDSCGTNSQSKLTCFASGGIGSYTYLLNPSGMSQSSNSFISLYPRNYIITVTDANSCSTFSNIAIPEKICCEEVFVPNAFSPNNDGRNDELSLKGINGIELKEFIICNRWGEIVFKTQHSFDSWNGHFKGGDAEIGAYYYFVSYRCLSNNKILKLKGDVILLR